MDFLECCPMGDHHDALHVNVHDIVINACMSVVKNKAIASPCLSNHHFFVGHKYVPVCSV